MIAITRLVIFCAEKIQDFQNPHRDWRAVLLQVRTNGLAKYYNISRQGGRGAGGIVAWEATTFFIKSTIIRI